MTDDQNTNEANAVGKPMVGDQPATAAPLARTSGSEIGSLSDAIGKIVMCTDGYERRLQRVDDRLGYYEVPLNGGAWMALSGTYIRSCRELFVGGRIISDDEWKSQNQ
jgi:hypothetical protein